MPELPEVQTVVNSLKKIKSKQIQSFTPLWFKVCYNIECSLIENKTRDKIIKDIYRIGKYIIIKLNKDYIVFHLRMTGYLYFSEKIKKNSYIRCYLKFNDSTYLIFEDIRKFGGFYYWRNLSYLKNNIGLDPMIDKSFTPKWLHKNLISRNRQMKSLLLDQSFICGLGNIYIDEILWKSSIHPISKSSLLSKKYSYKLYDAIKEILNDSLEHHGTTIMNFKFDNMKTGDYKDKLYVYSRNNKKCIRCNSIIIKIKAASRGTYICPNCQTNKT